MSYFKNSIIIEEKTPLITNPTNRVTVANELITEGRPFYTPTTIFKYIAYVLRKALSIFKR